MNTKSVDIIKFAKTNPTRAVKFPALGYFYSMNDAYRARGLTTTIKPREFFERVTNCKQLTDAIDNNTYAKSEVVASPVGYSRQMLKFNKKIATKPVVAKYITIDGKLYQEVI